jgi:cellulose biosynthesis protein BcsQ
VIKGLDVKMFRRKKSLTKKIFEEAEKFYKRQTSLNLLPSRQSISKSFHHGREIAQSKTKSEAVNKTKSFLSKIMAKLE